MEIISKAKIKKIFYILIIIALFIILSYIVSVVSIHLNFKHDFFKLGDTFSTITIATIFFVIFQMYFISIRYFWGMWADVDGWSNVVAGRWSNAVADRFAIIITLFQNNMSIFIRLWFDWIKWLVITGAITIVAEKTQDQILMLIKNLSYLIILFYIWVNVLTFFDSLSRKIEKYISGKTFSLTDKDSKIFIKICAFMFFFGLTYVTALFMLKLFLNWEIFLKTLVTKLPLT